MIKLINHLTTQFVLCLLLSCITSNLWSFDNAHFYRAPYFFSEPRLECPGLLTVQAKLAHGTSDTSYGTDHHTTPLLDLYGPYAMPALARGLPNLDPTNPYDLALIALEQLPSQPPFGTLSFDGSFSITEGTILLTQNFNCGFFAQAHLPIRKLSITGIRTTDLTPEQGILNASTPEWQTFLLLFPEIMQRYEIDLGAIERKGVGDLTILGGWTINYDQTEWLDFIDATIQLGFLFPTGKKSDPNKLFDLPLGYNGHHALAGNFAGAVGLFEWLTVGVGAHLLVFGRKTQLMRIRTSSDQSGLIKLAKIPIDLKPGSIIQTGIFFKADHACRGVSALVGYSYNRQGVSSAKPAQNSCCYHMNTINSDPQFRGWDQHTLHVALELDLTKECSRAGVRFGLFYNHLMRGTKVFKTNIIGGDVGIDATLTF